MKYKKVKLLLGAALLALAVTACGGEKEADSETAQAEETADQEEEPQTEGIRRKQKFWKHRRRKMRRIRRRAKWKMRRIRRRRNGRCAEYRSGRNRRFAEFRLRSGDFGSFREYRSGGNRTDGNHSRGQRTGAAVRRFRQYCGNSRQRTDGRRFQEAAAQSPDSGRRARRNPVFRRR